MSARARISVRRVVFSSLAVACAAFLSCAAYAGTTMEGCDPRVMELSVAAANARDVFNKAKIDQVYTQDESILALTCFNQLAAIAAEQVDAVFSNDDLAKATTSLKKDLSPVITDAMTSMLNNYTHTTGYMSGSVDYSPGAADMDSVDGWGSYDCTQIASLWDEISGEGTPVGAPYLFFDTIMACADVTDPACPVNGLTGDNFQTTVDAQASQNAIQVLQTAKDNLPVRDIPDFTGVTTPCAVLVAMDPASGLTCP